ncbi:MAG TPA: 3-carboxy-cis,cis-muconate cycloisomerase [Caulobacteraceae bacterium]|nr:3-carboxy-cis,cis-muconate cycloisomerase [Caulobacteraceae bacterium]
MASLLRDRPASTAAMIAALGDETLLRAALDFEAALARAQAAEGLIPAEAADVIAETCAGARFDIADLAEAAAHAGTLAIPLVFRLRALVAERDGQAAKLVHRGATSQDVADTALMLQAKAAAGLIVDATLTLTNALAGLAERYAVTPMLGRTLLQDALPITFGLRAANWLLGIDAALRRFEREATDALILQLGGASGSLAGLEFRVVERVAADLGLGVAPMPWQSRRDGVAGLAGALAILVGAIGKIARDVSLMAQSQVGEAFEPRIEGRGGSSAMDHKRNPTGCQVALSAAIRAPGIAAAIFSGLPQEQERGLGGWQAEAPGLATLFELAHGALAAMTQVIEGLEVDAATMSRNLGAAAVGSDVGQSADLVRRALASYRKER